MKTLVMDNRFFILTLIVVGLLSLLGSVLFPLLFTGMVYYHYTKEEIEQAVKESGFKGEVRVVKLR